MRQIRNGLLTSILLGSIYSYGQENNGLEILLETIESTRQISTISYTISKTERIDGQLVQQVSVNKLHRKPFKVYLKQQSPKKGLEALYLEGEKVLVNPNGFPWFNLRLSPLGKLIRENQHHTILESGYDHVMNVLEHIVLKYQPNSHTMVKVDKDTVWDSQPVWKVKLDNPLYRIGDYTMQKDETVMQVARRDMLSEYWLVEQNEALSHCNDKRPGATIKKPSDYAPSMELYIDKSRMIPLVIKVYDGEGLFEHYAYSDVKVNPTFESEEFTESYPSYGF